MKKSINIIRVEHLDGIGMFWHSNSRVYAVRNILPKLNERHEIFNDPYEDNLHIDKGDNIWFCAYKSIEQIQRWILKKEFKTLFKNDYKVLLLEVNDYQEGNDQIIYTKESIINSKDISDLFLTQKRNLKK